MMQRPAGICLLLFLAGCATTKNFELNVSTKDGTAPATVQALKCAAQSAGWNITHADEFGISARQTVGLDNVPLTLNLQLQPGNPSKVVMTTYEPRGISGSTLYQRPVLEGLKRCGANVTLTP